MRAIAVVVAALLAGICAMPASAVVYVRADAPGPVFDGASWDTAYQKIQQGIDAAAASQDEVRVARGTYDERLTLRPGVKLYGGFAGDEDSRDQRDWRTNLAIVDGAMRGPCVNVPSGISSTARIDGFVLLRGTAGGCVNCTSSSPVIANNLIMEGAGGGVFCNSSSSPQILNNRIIGNSASSWGGGVTCKSGSSPLIANNVIAANSGSTGAGICCAYSSSPTIANNTIVYNNSASYGGGISILDNCYPAVYGNIVAFNSQGINYGSGCVFRDNCVYGNQFGDYKNLSDQTGLNGNISADPELADCIYGDMHIQPDSPCRDSGYDGVVQTGWVDIDGAPRIDGAHVDIGADESDDAVHTAAPYIVRIAPDGDDANDGQSWQRPMRTLTAAVEAVTLRGGEVWVKAGTYVGRTMLRAYVYIYGGFAGTEDQRSQRNWAANRTVLDGGKADNILWGRQGFTRCAVDGFTLTNGRSRTDGGAIYLDRTSPTISNCLIMGNIGGLGGGIYARDGCPTISNNVFIGNVANEGGAIYVLSASALPTITNNTIVGNSASFGGGVRYDMAGGTLANNIIAFNSQGITATNSGVWPVLRSNCVYGNRTGDYSQLTPGTTDISFDPKLASSAYGNVHIQPDSPCVNAGDDGFVQAAAMDMDFQARVQGDHVDIGADESDGASWVFVPRVIRVANDGDDSDDGSSWEHPMRTIQGAIDSASGTGAEIWVKAGTYRENISPVMFDYLYGGFSGGETARAERDPRRNVTTIDGRQNGSVVTFRGVGTLSELNGFTITNGTGTIYGSSICGGGIFCISSPVIAGNVISGNKAGIGGGFYGSGHSAAISGNRVAGNTGGGLAFEGYSSHVVTDNLITSNKGAWGGGIYSGLSFGRVERNTIVDNRSEGEGGGICSADTMSPQPTYADNLVAGNVAAHGGGGMFFYLCAPKVYNNTIAKNTAQIGGGIYVNSCTPDIANNIVAFCSSGVISDRTVSMRTNDVYGNTDYNYSGTAAGTGDISEDPQFLAPWAGEYHLRASSPCLNRGTDSVVTAGSTDLDARPRISGGHADIGCYEWDASPYRIRQLSQAKAIPEWVDIELCGKPVSATFDGAFYIEEPDRSSGLRVLSGASVAAGDLVTLSGRLTLDGGERSLLASSASVVSGEPGLVPGALGVPCRSVGGGAFFWQQDGWKCGQQGITDGSGLNNIGLLIRLSGVLDSDRGSVYIDDGSGRRVRCIGIDPSVSGCVTLTGVASCVQSGGTLDPAIRVVSVDAQY